jgi:Na+-transporting methylmalonyl-CoA/oxaloacetate decarboxylase beta subunit
MYETALSADGTLPATHWISSGLILQDFATMLENPAIVYGAAAQAGIDLPQDSIEALLSQCDISDESAEAALARLGFQIVEVAL